MPVYLPTCQVSCLFISCFIFFCLFTILFIILQLSICPCFSIYTCLSAISCLCLCLPTYCLSVFLSTCLSVRGGRRASSPGYILRIFHPERIATRVHSHASAGEGRSVPQYLKQLTRRFSETGTRGRVCDGRGGKSERRRPRYTKERPTYRDGSRYAEKKPAYTHWTDPHTERGTGYKDEEPFA